MPRDRNGRNHGKGGRFTAERTTETTTTHRVTERLTRHDTDTLDAIPPITGEIRWAPGHADVFPTQATQWREQRRTQYQRTWDLLAAAADDGRAELDEGTLRQAVTMLRALPGASCMEAEHGRSI